MLAKRRNRSNSVTASLGGAFLVFAITGCAGAPPADDPIAVAMHHEANDPMEPLNRGILEVNLMLDKALLKPVAFGYKEAVPYPVQTMIGNFMRNLRAPVVFVNDLLQGETERAGDTLARFLMNSGLGMFGVLDIASEFGVPRHDEDFGQTAAVWGIEEGPYLMLPLLGPSSLRDAAGKVVDFFFDPLTYVSYGTFGYPRFIAQIVHVRARRYDEINRMEKTSLDFYATVRSLYRQKRADEIRNRRPEDRQISARVSHMPWREVGTGEPRRADRGSTP